MTKPIASSPRIVRPAWREAQVANVHQFAPEPLRSAIAGGEQRVGVGDLEVAQDGAADRGDPQHVVRGDYAVRVPITAPSVSPASLTVSMS